LVSFIEKGVLVGEIKVGNWFNFKEHKRQKRCKKIGVLKELQCDGLMAT
jgi:hypothetical protein